MAIAVRADVLAVQPLGIGEDSERIERVGGIQRQVDVRKVGAAQASPEISSCCHAVSILTSIAKYSKRQWWEALDNHGKELNRQRQ